MKSTITLQMTRDPKVLKLPADHEAVFSNSDEFSDHHMGIPQMDGREDPQW